MQKIVIGNETNINKALKNFELELDECWESGADNIEVYLIHQDSQNMWNSLLKYLQEHSDEFKYEVVKEFEKLLINFVI
ncbi:hypothetical protein E1I18_00410 [Mycoplasmopsis mucosicanis]|uniref:Uncharacterized protein n=1 Tax=Mycoplasmopsis mucosicanis TaxID=458208 RepID=A0A507SYB5_9BACT|nr:hypothetical protein [Mycoplasmopsis mucosicanis]TQC54223.1 hypothetical protein E1I18_00410 [Mycoplasmopsis mucosicanis]